MEQNNNYYIIDNNLDCNLDIKWDGNGKQLAKSWTEPECCLIVFCYIEFFQSVSLSAIMFWKGPQETYHLQKVYLPSCGKGWREEKKDACVNVEIFSPVFLLYEFVLLPLTHVNFS